MSPPTVLLVEDEPRISDPLSEALREERFDVEVVRTASAALGRAASSQPPDPVLLDLMLPDGDGPDVCREIRRTSDVPIISLTARGEKTDRIVGLEIGADDYVARGGAVASPRDCFNPSASVRFLGRRPRSLARSLRRLGYGQRRHLA